MPSAPSILRVPGPPGQPPKVMAKPLPMANNMPTLLNVDPATVTIPTLDTTEFAGTKPGAFVAPERSADEMPAWAAALLAAGGGMLTPGGSIGDGILKGLDALQRQKAANDAAYNLEYSRARDTFGDQRADYRDDRDAFYRRQDVGNSTKKSVFDMGATAIRGNNATILDTARLQNDNARLGLEEERLDLARAADDRAAAEHKAKLPTMGMNNAAPGTVVYGSDGQGGVKPLLTVPDRAQKLTPASYGDVVKQGQAFVDAQLNVQRDKDGNPTSSGGNPLLPQIERKFIDRAAQIMQANPDTPGGMSAAFQQAWQEIGAENGFRGVNGDGSTNIFMDENFVAPKAPAQGGPAGAVPSRATGATQAQGAQPAQAAPPPVDQRQDGMIMNSPKGQVRWNAATKQWDLVK